MLYPEYGGAKREHLIFKVFGEELVYTGGRARLLWKTVFEPAAVPSRQQCLILENGKKNF